MINLLLEKLLKKAKKDPNKLVAKTPDEDFLPYVCHYDPNTIITKNGELLQIIRITGFSSSSVVSEIISLRDTVRDSILEHVKDNKVAFWFTTIRRKKNITPKGEFKDVFSQAINDAWVKENKWDDQFVNELYITIIVEGIDTSIVNAQGFMRSFSYMATKSLHSKFLSEAHKKLSTIVNNIIGETEGYGAKLLGIVEWDDVLYSEQMRFFGKITNLYEDRYPLVANDISSDLSSHKIAFGDRVLEVIGNNNKNFAAMLSIKEYFEASTNSLDRILQLPMEFIVTQSFDFVFSKKDLDPYEYQDYILRVSGDEDFRESSGIANFMESKRGAPTDFGKLQTTIMLIAKNREDLERDVRSALDQFGALGFIVIREDIFMEHCFWSQLPGNFRYLARQKLINTERVGGFAALHNYPSGLIGGNKWGAAITVLKTVLNTPYFFNFHDHDLGHTLILGPHDSGKTVLMNFLLAQSRKLNTKLFYFDFDRSSKAFIQAIGGEYYTLSQDEEVKNEKYLALNPLALQKNSENKNFLSDFFAAFIGQTKDVTFNNEIKLIPQIVDRILTSNANNFATAMEVFNAPETRKIYAKLKDWRQKSARKSENIFEAKEEIDWASQIMAFDLTEILEDKSTFIPTVTYLLHQIESSLDGSPAIIAINEAWEFFDNPILGPKIGAFLNRMKEKNCVVIFSSQDIEHIAASKEVSGEIKKNIATAIFMPNPEPNKVYKTVFGLNEEEMNIVKMMGGDEHNFLFKHGEDSVIFTMDLAAMVEFTKVLSADDLTLTALEEVISANITEENPNPTPEVWVPQLLEVLKEIEKERVIEEKKRIKEEDAERRRLMKERLELNA